VPDAVVTQMVLDDAPDIMTYVLDDAPQIMTYVIDSEIVVSPVIVGPQGPQGPPGPQGEWVGLTQAEYDALPFKDPDTLYVIIS
jgi:hypothetical protein